MVDFQVLPVTMAHSLRLAANMRAQDVAEVEAVGQHPIPAVLKSVEISTECYTLLLDGEVAAIFGVVDQTPTSLSTQRALAWVLTAKPVDKHKRAFFRLAAGIVEHLGERYGELHNWVDNRYTGAVRLFSRLGFRPKLTTTHNGVEFSLLTRRAPWA